MTNVVLETDPSGGIIIDLFAGGGGVSVGLEMAFGRHVDIAVNHDPQALSMHRVNHPRTLHLKEDIQSVDLKPYVKKRHVVLMWASPDCTHHSRAKGGKPVNHEIRMLPMAVVKHAEDLRPDVIIMENVKEIMDWGPLDENNRPIKERKGEDFCKFIAAMTALGYVYEYRILVAADYGIPTTRERWFGIFRCDGKDIVWPEPTHSKGGANGLKPWEPIYKYLDLGNFGKSIFGRKKPLVDKTMRRIAAGMNKFVFNCPNPFIVQVNHGGDNFRGQSVFEPIPTITQKNGLGLVTPIIVPFIDKAYGGNYKGTGSKITDPLHTITTVDHNRLITPLLIQYHSETSKNMVRGQQVTDPIQTIDTSNRYGLVMAFLTKFYKTGVGQSLWEPIHTITTSPGHFGQVSIMAIPKEKLFASLDKSMKEQDEIKDIVQKCTWVSQFLIDYYGSGTGQSLHDPLHTVVTKDKFALITVLGNEYVILDIFLRMLSPEELKLGQGFPKDYIIDRDIDWNTITIKQQVAKIGNSVPPGMAEVLALANCPYLKVGERQPNMRLDYSQPQIKFAYG